MIILITSLKPSQSANMSCQLHIYLHVILHGEIHHSTVGYEASLDLPDLAVGHGERFAKQL